MKKGLLFFAKFSLISLILMFVLNSLYSNNVKDNIQEKFKMVNNDWLSITHLQEVKNNHLIQLIEVTPKGIPDGADVF